ncbi:hypothetical protein BaRGS_00035793, partial [Batillaria attramentaria]
FTTQQGTRNIAPPLLRGNAGGLYDYEGELDEFDAYSGQPYAFDDYQGQSYVSGAYRGQPAASGAQRGQPAASGAYRGQPAASGAHRGQPGASGAQRGQPATSGAHKGQPARGRDHPNDLSGIGNLDARFAADPRFSNAPGSFRNLTVPLSKPEIESDEVLTGGMVIRAATGRLPRMKWFTSQQTVSESAGFKDTTATAAGVFVLPGQVA